MLVYKNETPAPPEPKMRKLKPYTEVEAARHITWETEWIVY